MSGVILPNVYTITINMKHSILRFIFLLSVICSCASRDKDPSLLGTTDESKQDSSTHNSKNQMEIKIGSSTFTATLYETTTATAFKALLPMTIDMADLNGNEKYVDLPRSLTTNASKPGIIKTGDLMLYGSSTLVLFYKTFSTSYSYTKLGRIDDVTGLVATLGTGSVSITYEQQ